MTRPKSYERVQRTSGTVHRKQHVAWDTARCCGTDDTLFFDQSEKDEVHARNLCYNECPIRIACFMYGLTQAFGMWGGATEKQRRALRVQRKLVECQQCRHTVVALYHTLFVAEVCPRCGVWWTS